MARFNLRNGNLTPKKIENFVNKQIKEAWAPPVPFKVGTTYIFRTITMCDIGTVINIVGNFIMLDDTAVWIPDTGHWGKCLVDPKEIKIIEPFHKIVGINVDSIVDFTEWTLSIPKSTDKIEGQSAENYFSGGAEVSGVYDIHR